MLRDHVVLLLTGALTSAIVIMTGRRRGLSQLGPAIVTAVELIGATTLFFAANLAAGFLLVLLARRFTPFFASLYEVTDVALLLLALFQALAFESWRRLPGRTAIDRRASARR